MRNGAFSPVWYFCSFHIPEGAPCMLNRMQVLSLKFMCRADLSFPLTGCLKWNNQFAAQGWVGTLALFPSWTADQRFPRYQWSANRLHLFVLQSPVQLSLHTHPLSHPPFGDSVYEATQCILCCMSVVPDREQMFGSLCVSGQSQET